MSALRPLQRTASGGSLASKPIHSHKLNAARHASATTDENMHVAAIKRIIAPRVKGKTSTSDDKPTLTRQVRTAVGSQTIHVETKEVGVGDEGEEETDEQLIFGDTPSLAYWRVLALRHEEELGTQMEENIRLLDEIARLREENDSLRVAAEEGEEYAQLLNQCLQHADGSTHEEEKEN